MNSRNCASFQLFSLLAPTYQLYESCQLWREYLRCQLDFAEVKLHQGDIDTCPYIGVQCDCMCHRSDDLSPNSSTDGWTCEDFSGDEFETAHKSRTKSWQRSSQPERQAYTSCDRRGATEDASGLNQAALRQAALADWLARKSSELTVSRAEAARRRQEEEAKRSEAERLKIEDGRAAYQSWLAVKRKAGWGKKQSMEANKAENQSKEQASNQAAIEKWLGKKNAEQAEQRQRRRVLDRQTKAAKEADEEERRSRSASKREDWEVKKKLEARQKRLAREKSEQLATTERLEAEDQKREAARLRYQDWCDKKDAMDSSEDQENNRSSAPWRPNTTVRRK